MANLVAILSRRARLDVRGIARYSKEQWGSQQTERYMASLDVAFDRVAEYPGLGSERPSLRVGVRVLPVERHLVVYDVAPSGVEILRVVHQSMRLTDLDLD